MDGDQKYVKLPFTASAFIGNSGGIDFQDFTTNLRFRGHLFC